MNRSSFRLHAGTASILLIFVTLCLISFAVLSLTGANADLRLSKKIAERNEVYYDAHNRGIRLIAETDEALMKLYRESAGEADFLARVQSTYGTDAFEETFPVSDLQVLHVRAVAAWPKRMHGSTSSASLPQGANPRCLIVTEFSIETLEEAYQFEEEPLNLPH